MSDVIILPPFGGTTVISTNQLTTEVYNQTGSTIAKMSVVYINGSHGNLPTITKSIATSEIGSTKTMGIVQADIGDQKDGIVVVAGRLENLNTNIVGWSEGQGLWLSPTTAGGITNVKPSAPNHMVFVGTLIRKHPTHGVIEVKIQNGFEMEELHNVSAGSPSNNDVLIYESATSLWKTKSTTYLVKNYSRVVATEGGSIIIADATSHVLIDPVSTRTNYTITMPASPVDGQEVLISSGEFGVTNLALNPNAGQSFSTGAAITTLSGNSHAVFKWIGAVSKWYKIG